MDQTVHHETVRAADAAGRHIHGYGSAAPGHRVLRVLHVHPYDEDGIPWVALTTVVEGGDQRPTVQHWEADRRLPVATEVDLQAIQAVERRRNFAAGLVELAQQIETHALPLGYQYLSVVLKSRDLLDQWAATFGATVTVGKTNRIPSIDVSCGPLSISVQCSPEPEQASTGDAGPSVAGADAGEGAAPAGSGDRAPDPATPAVEHYQDEAWTGEPGMCGVSCACGVEFDGFNGLREPKLLLDQHIEDETAATQTAAEAPDMASADAPGEAGDSPAAVAGAAPAAPQGVGAAGVTPNLYAIHAALDAAGIEVHNTEADDDSFADLLLTPIEIVDRRTVTLSWRPGENPWYVQESIRRDAGPWDRTTWLVGAADPAGIAREAARTLETIAAWDRVTGGKR